MKSILFFSSMIFSSGLSFLRVIILATILSVVDFTYYTTILAAGAFIGSFYSFGIIEGTFKKFPIWIAQNELGLLKNSLANILKILFTRFCYVCIIISLITYLINADYILPVIISISMGFLHSIISILASTQRAIGDLNAYAFSSLIRSVLAIILVVLIAWLTNEYLLVLFAEIIAMLGGSFIAYVYSMISLKKLNIGSSVLDIGKVQIDKKNKNDLILFVSYTILSVPFYLDRSFVTLNFTELIAAQYALLALFLSISFLLINAISQKVSPEIFKIIELTKNYKLAYNYVFKWSGLFIITWIIIIVFLWFFFSSGLVPEGLLKYKLTDNLFVVLLLLGSLSVTNLLEFVIISIDKEKKFLKSAFVYLLFLGLTAFVTFFFEFQLMSFIWMMVFSRFVYLSSLVYYMNPSKILK